MPPLTKNLGPVRAIQYGLTAPSNIKMLWFDDNIGVKALKYYNTGVNDWVLLSYGISGDKHETYSFTSVSSIILTHTMGKLPAINICDVNGFMIEAEVQYDLMNINKIYITFNTAQTGLVILN